MYGFHLQKSINGLKREEIRGGLLVLVQEDMVKTLKILKIKLTSYRFLTIPKITFLKGVMNDNEKDFNV